MWGIGVASGKHGDLVCLAGQAAEFSYRICLTLPTNLLNGTMVILTRLEEHVDFSV